MAQESAEKSSTSSVIDDIRETLSSLANGTTAVVNDVGTALNREIATAIEISERLRNETVSRRVLAEARENTLLTDVRTTAHNLIDLTVDVVGVVVVTTANAVSRYADSMTGTDRRADVADA